MSLPVRHGRLTISSLRGIRLLGLFAGITIAVAAVFLWKTGTLFEPPFPAELHNSTFVGYAEDGSITTYHRDGPDYVADGAAGSRVSVTKRGEHTGAVIRNGEGSYTLLADGTPVTFASSTAALVDISEDGSRIAFSESHDAGNRVLPGREAEVLLPESSLWKVVIAKGASTERHTGVAPLFLGSTTMAWLSPRGVIGYDVSTGIESLLVGVVSPTITTPLLRSADGTLIGVRDQGTKSIAIFSVSDLKVQPVATVSYESAASFTISNDALYFVRITTRGSEIWKQAFTESTPHRILLIPAELRVNRVIL